MWKLLGADGKLIRAALVQLKMTSGFVIESIDDLIEKLNTEMIIGPLTVPEEYSDGVKIKNAEQYLKIFEAIKILVKEIK